jgi:hypothetical protein
VESTLLTIRQRQIAFLLVLVLTLAAGLRTRGYQFQNRVEPASSGLGLRFEMYGAAYTDEVLDSGVVSELNGDGFEIFLSLGPEHRRLDGFHIVAQIHSGNDATQLVIGRWSDYLIAMNGDDYRSRSEHPRITARLTEAQRLEGVDILVRSTPSGSEIRFDGERVAERAGTRLTIPSSPRSGRIVLGNSVAGSHPWAGEMRSFELRPAEPSDAVPLVRYRLGEVDAGGGPGEGALSSVLTIPRWDVVADKRFLALPFDHQFELTRRFVGDVALNLVGFIPVGVMLVLVGSRIPRSSPLASAIVIAAMLSLLIEVLQAWIPSRRSSALDLALNTMGGALGAFVAVRLGLTRARRPSEPAARNGSDLPDGVD